MGCDRADPRALRGAARLGTVAPELDEYVDLNLRLPELLLMRVDKMTMGVGLEGRVPFLDHRFVGAGDEHSERAARRAAARLKHLLKTAVRGLVPDELIDRRKQGFGVPVDELFDGRLAALAASPSCGASAMKPICSTAPPSITRDADGGQGSKTLVSAEPRDVVADVHRAATPPATA